MLCELKTAGWDIVPSVRAVTNLRKEVVNMGIAYVVSMTIIVVVCVLALASRANRSNRNNRKK